MIKSKSNFHFVFLIALFAVVIVSVIVMVTSQTSSSVLSPSQVVEKISKPGDRFGSLYRVRVAGRVGEQAVDYQVDPSFKLEFVVVDRPAKGEELQEGGEGLRVIFEDVKPDMFANGRDVLIDGNVIDGVLHASALLTQCPSKYEPEDVPHDVMPTAEAAY